jgi:hypothetical protein
MSVHFTREPGERPSRPAVPSPEAHAHVRNLCARLVDELASLHADIELMGTGVDIRAEFQGRTLCRLVPYRELVHIQVGDSPVWEARIRSERDYLDAVDMILRAFVRMTSV